MLYLGTLWPRKHRRKYHVCTRRQACRKLMSAAGRPLSTAIPRQCCESYEHRRALVESLHASATYNSEYDKQQNLCYSALKTFGNGPLSVLRCVRLSRLTPCESQFELRWSCDMQRDYNNGNEYITHKECKNIHVTVCSSVKAHRL